jgi:hypothetical protein
LSGWYDGIAETVRGMGMTSPSVELVRSEGMANVLRVHDDRTFDDE